MACEFLEAEVGVKHAPVAALADYAKHNCECAPSYEVVVAGRLDKKTVVSCRCTLADWQSTGLGWSKKEARRAAAQIVLGEIGDAAHPYIRKRAEVFDRRPKSVRRDWQDRATAAVMAATGWDAPMATRFVEGREKQAIRYATQSGRGWLRPVDVCRHLQRMALGGPGQTFIERAPLTHDLIPEGHPLERMDAPSLPAVIFVLSDCCQAHTVRVNGEELCRQCGDPAFGDGSEDVPQKEAS